MSLFSQQKKTPPQLLYMISWMSKIDYRIELDDHSQEIDRKHGKIMQKK